MPQAIVKISDRANRVLNIVKAKYGLKDKSEAINVMAEEYEEEILEPVLRHEYIEKLEKIRKEKPIKIDERSMKIGGKRLEDIKKGRIKGLTENDFKNYVKKRV